MRMRLLAHLLALGYIALVWLATTHDGHLDHGYPDGVVDVDDLLGIIKDWGGCGPCPPTCLADINVDCAVDVDDLLAVINQWGPCP